jgi:hypothetical protein
MILMQKLVLAPMAMLLAAVASAHGEEPQAGRYQMVAVPASQSQTFPQTLLLDTATGQTWILYHETVRMAFCGIMQSTRLPPMAALSLAATAVGLLYLEVAAAHEGDNSCPCGWEPHRAADLEALQTSLALASKPPHANFHAIQVEGHA